MRKQQSHSEKSTPPSPAPRGSAVCSHPRARAQRRAIAGGVFLFRFFHGPRKEKSWSNLERSTGTWSPVSRELPLAGQNGYVPAHVSTWRRTSYTMENPSNVRSMRYGWSMCRPARRPMIRRHREMRYGWSMCRPARRPMIRRHREPGRPADPRGGPRSRNHVIMKGSRRLVLVSGDPRHFAASARRPFEIPKRAPTKTR